MRLLSRIWFPVAVAGAAIAGIAGSGSSVHMAYVPEPMEMADTVIYPHDGYKLHRRGNFDDAPDDSLLHADDSLYNFEEDTVVQIFARDTMKAPDSLRFTDPFRYRYYVALRDSLTHVTVRDSLRHRFDSLMEAGDIDMARLDSLEWKKLDSIYVADSAAFAKAAFDAWYASLSKQDRKRYDLEQEAEIKMAIMDSLNKIKEDKKAYRDSITENTPRILETFALPDSLHYKRIVAWKLEQDFQDLRPYIPDTTYNYRYYDHPFQRNDVNSTWLGVAGSPVQYYDYTKRRSDEGVEFYKALESWSFSPRTISSYNTKTPYTELAYWGTLAAKDSKEQDNIHIFTTQNILPSLNFSILLDRFGGGGMLENEKTVNRTQAVQINYLGKKYMMHVGYIHNSLEMGENGGVQNISWIRDTTVDSREIPVALKEASSKINKNTVFLNQEFRIPFNFINKIKARRDSNFVYNADSLDRNITTAFIGHSSEFSNYTRNYNDKITSGFGQKYYHDRFLYDLTTSRDSLREARLDNKVFIKLQPWADNAIVSRLNVGIGDYVKWYAVQDTLGGNRSFSNEVQNSMYLYAGVEGQWKNYFDWNAKADYVLLGHDAADFGVEANAAFKFFPFRRARKSPVNINAHFETSLRRPDFYQQRMFSNHFSWNNNFGKISATEIKGDIDIPHWQFKVGVGYNLLGNTLYYDNESIIRQYGPAMSVLSASLEKNFKIGPLHLDNKALVQLSSNQAVVPVPLAAFNLRWYFQFVVQRDETRTRNVMEMQIGVNAFYNTKWNSPAWNPNLGVFYNQTERLYNNGPFFDVFVNVQWKRACVFIKYQNVGRGWPMKKPDYFSADNHIITTDGLDGLKFGIFWPFYIQPNPRQSR